MRRSSHGKHHCLAAGDEMNNNCAVVGVEEVGAVTVMLNVCVLPKVAASKRGFV